MLIGPRHCPSPLGRSTEKAFLDEVWFVHFRDRLRFLADHRSQVIDPDRTAGKLVDNSFQQSDIDLVETEIVDLEDFESPRSDIAIDRPISFDLGVIANPSQPALARRAVPLERRAISVAPVSSTSKESRRASRRMISVSSSTL